MSRHVEEPKVLRIDGNLWVRFRYWSETADRSVRKTIPAETNNRKTAERSKRALVATWLQEHPEKDVPPEASDSATDRSFKAAWKLWVEERETDPNRPLSPGYIRALRQHGRILAESFSTVDDINALAIEQHKRNRRAKGKRGTTIRHEVASLQLFVAWLLDKGVFSTPPKVVLPDRDDRETVCLAPEQVQQLLAQVPVRQERGPGFGRPCREYFRFMWLQGLRDQTTSRLIWPDYDPKKGELHIRAEIDKNKYDRVITLFAEARALLDKLRPNIPGKGYIFGPAKRWRVVKRAAVKAGLAPLRITGHVLRHSRTTELCSRPDADPAAVAFLLGWRDVATLYARYFHPSKRHADRFVAAVDARRPRRSRKS